MSEYNILMAVVITLAITAVLFGMSKGMVGDDIIMSVGAVLLIIAMLLCLFVSVMVAWIVLNVTVDKVILFHIFGPKREMFFETMREAKRIVEERKDVKRKTHTS